MCESSKYTPLDFSLFQAMIQVSPEAFWHVYHKLQNIRREVEKVKKARDQGGLKEYSLKELDFSAVFLALKDFHAEPGKLETPFEPSFISLRAENTKLKEQIHRLECNDPRNDHSMFHRSD